MDNNFEVRFNDFLTNIVLSGLEYVQNMAEEININLSWRERKVSCNVFFCNVFYRINGILIEKPNFDDALSEAQKKVFRYDLLKQRQEHFSDSVIENLTNAKKNCN